MSDSVKPSVPEPPPINKGEPVTPHVIVWINSLTVCSIEEKKEAIELIESRDKYGFDKYGQHLMTGDERNTIEDARQELGDFIQYWFKAKMNREDMEKLYPLCSILKEIIHLIPDPDMPELR